MLLSWWRNLSRRLPRSISAKALRPRPTGRLPYRLSLESLEDRTLLAATYLQVITGGLEGPPTELIQGGFGTADAPIQLLTFRDALLFATDPEQVYPSNQYVIEFAIPGGGSQQTILLDPADNGALPTISAAGKPGLHMLH